VRRRRLHRWVPEPTDTPDGARHVELELLVGALDPDRRVAFVLTQLIGCSYEEAAQACAVPVGTIRSRVARARGDLARVMRTAEAI